MSLDQQSFPKGFDDSSSEENILNRRSLQVTTLKPKNLFENKSTFKDVFKSLLYTLVNYTLFTISVVIVLSILYAPQNKDLVLYENPIHRYIDTCCSNNSLLFITPQCEAYDECDTFLRIMLLDNYSYGINNCCYDIKSTNNHKYHRYCSFYCLDVRQNLIEYVMV